jgi:two-component system, OmpR family, response regulator
MLAQLNDQEQAENINPPASVRARSPGILIADDLGLILTLLKLELQERGLNVWVASDGAAAIDLYRRHRFEIDLVLLDVQMPGLDGPSTLSALQKLDPDVRACFMTGNSGIYSEQDLIERGAVWVFNKPFRTAEVAHFIQIMLSACARLATDDPAGFICDWQPMTKERTPCAS